MSFEADGVMQKEDHTSEDIPMILVGNKIDLPRREVGNKAVKGYANNYNCMPYIQTSAKTHLEVQEVFYTLVREIRHRMEVRARVKKKKKGYASSCEKCAHNDGRTETSFIIIIVCKCKSSFSSWLLIHE